MRTIAAIVCLLVAGAAAVVVGLTIEPSRRPAQHEPNSARPPLTHGQPKEKDLERLTRPAVTAAAASAEGISLGRRLFVVVVPAGAAKPITMSLDNGTDRPLRVLSVTSSCRCVRAGRIPEPIRARARGEIALDILGVLPGTKQVLIRTDAGNLTAVVQVLVDGQGKGVDMARQAASRLDGVTGVHILGIIHNLKGKARGCGCAGSALGGLDRLSALAAALPSGQITWVATGDWQGGSDAAGLRSLLLELGVQVSGRAPANLSVGDRKLSLCTGDGSLGVPESHDLVVSDSRDGEKSTKLLVPQLDDGMGVDLFVLSPKGLPIATFAVPLDDSFPRDLRLAKRIQAMQPQLGQPLTDRNLSMQCQPCHPEAYETWAGTRHAVALSSLPADDRAADCAVCHSTSYEHGRARDVHCQSCHHGTLEHMRDPRQQTTLADCTNCHDERHHPTFDRNSLLEKIRHK